MVYYHQLNLLLWQPDLCSLVCTVSLVLRPCSCIDYHPTSYSYSQVLTPCYTCQQPHINGDRRDISIENMTLVWARQHQRIHHQIKKKRISRVLQKWDEMDT